MHGALSAPRLNTMWSDEVYNAPPLKTKGDVDSFEVISG